jgi:hypothetical protein
MTGLFGAPAATFAARNQEDRTKRLYQWLSQRASFFRSDTVSQSTGHTVRTEVTVQQESMTLLAGAAAVFDRCPLCGQKLVPAQEVGGKLRLSEGSISQKRDA